MAEEKKISKVKLSNGKIYSFFDKDAIHFEDGKLVVGNAIIDNLIINEKLKILEINDVDVNEYTRVLVQNSTTGEIAGRNKNQLLEDIGGCSYNMNEVTGVLSLKIGKQ